MIPASCNLRSNSVWHNYNKFVQNSKELITDNYFNILKKYEKHLWYFYCIFLINDVLDYKRVTVILLVNY